MKKLSDLFWLLLARIADAYSVLGIHGTSVLLSAIAGGAYAAWATEWLAAWGPIAWLGSGMLVALLVVGGLMGWARYRVWMATAAVVRKTMHDEGAVNPLSDLFERKRIRLSQIASPIDNVIDKKTFTRCEILGPANVVLEGGVTQHNELHGCDFVLLKPGAYVSQAYKLRLCTVQWSRLHAITFLIPEQMAPLFSGSLNWITRGPDDIAPKDASDEPQASP